MVHHTSQQIQQRALRAAEIEADAILMAKNGVDGVYNADPKKDKTAVKFEELTHRDVINKGLVSWTQQLQPSQWTTTLTWLSST